jgi:hypothetical protein
VHPGVRLVLRVSGQLLGSQAPSAPPSHELLSLSLQEEGAQSDLQGVSWHRCEDKVTELEENGVSDKEWTTPSR